jgi:hypothetical protein
MRTQSSLDVTDDTLNEISSSAMKLVFDYLKTISERPVRAENHAGKTTASIDAELSTEGVPLDKLIDECRTIMDLSRHNGHPRFFGYVASPSTPIGAYGDLIASALNANITCWRSGPAGTELERMVVRWLGSLIHYDREANGLLTSGGSMANMIALLIASRRQSGADASRRGLWNSGRPMTVYASEEVHMSIPKAADILGFGRDQVRVIECDDRQRMRVDQLASRIESDLREGLRPFGFTSTALTALPVFWTNVKARSLKASSALILYRSIHTSGFTFRSMRAAFYSAMPQQHALHSTRKTRITSRRTDTPTKRRSRSGTTAWNSRAAFAR